MLHSSQKLKNSSINHLLKQKLTKCLNKKEKLLKRFSPRPPSNLYNIMHPCNNLWRPQSSISIQTSAPSKAFLSSHSHQPPSCSNLLYNNNTKHPQLKCINSSNNSNSLQLQNSPLHSKQDYRRIAFISSIIMERSTTQESANFLIKFISSKSCNSNSH